MSRLIISHFVKGLTIIMMSLAFHPEVQEKVYEEIREAVDDNDGSVNLDYDSISKLTYLEQAFHESLR